MDKNALHRGLSSVLLISILIPTAFVTRAAPRQMGTGETPSAAVDEAPAITTSVTSTRLTSSSNGAGAVRINEVMPKPDAGGHEWVELFNLDIFELYLPLVLRNAFGGGTVASLPSPISTSARTTGAPVDISGWQLTDEDGNAYTIPDALPEVPRGGYVLVIFDGLESVADDYDFSDGLAVLHTPTGYVDVFEDDADQIALYSSSVHSPDTIVDFVAWNAPPGDNAANAYAAEIWSYYSFVNMDIGFGAEIAGVEPLAGASLGLHSTRLRHDRASWSTYLGEDLSPGADNPLPRPYASTVAPGQEMAADGFALGWSWVAYSDYQFQMDDDPAFGSPLVDVVLDAPWYAPEELLPEGSYWWRVRALSPDGDLSAWTEPAAIGVSGLEGAGGSSGEVLGAAAEHKLAVTLLRQRKDTALLCLDGCNEGDPNDDSPEEAWDSPHPTDNTYEHGKLNCTRASIAMIVTRYGGSLSQDRIAYEESNVGGSPYGDLAHNVGGPQSCWTDGNDAIRILAWALGVDETDILYSLGKPPFEDLKGWLDDGRPVLRVKERGGEHATVIAGYRERFLGAVKEVLLLDPRAGSGWVNYERNFEVICYYVPPAAAPDVRSDEDAITEDSDLDGIMDFDEINRWNQPYNNLDPNSLDTDGDMVPDKADMREYLFDDRGNPIDARFDFDGDFLRKEADPDNDGGGSPDGCEDTDHDGRYEPLLLETSNFDPAEERDCVGLVINFEAAPGEDGMLGTPDDIQLAEKTTIENQYSALGIRFYLVQGGLPFIGTQGPPEVGFRSVHGPGLDDTPARSGINTLTDGYTRGRDIGVEFTFAASHAELTLIDFRADSSDGNARPGRTVFLRAYDAEELLISSDSYTTTGEEPEVFLVVLQVDGPGIRRIELEGSGVDSGIGIDDLLITYP